LGVPIVSNDRVQELELYRIKSASTTIHLARLWFPKSNDRKCLFDLINYVGMEAMKLSHEKADVIVFGCTSGSFFGGLDFNKRLRIIEDETGIPATTTCTAMISALEYLKAKKLTIVSPYQEWLNLIEKKFFEDNGFTVMKVKSLGCVTAEDMTAVRPTDVVESAKDPRSLDPEAIPISCTSLRALVRSNNFTSRWASTS
jgi:maleate isomerase